MPEKKDIVQGIQGASGALAGGSILEPMGTELSTPAGGARRYRKPLKSFRWCDIRALLSESFSAWIRHNAQRLGAALAFYTLFSITPLLLVVISIAALVLDRTAAEYQIVHEVNDLVGPPGAQAVQALLEGSHHTAHGVLATVLGLFTLIFGASGVLLELRDALNTIWEVPTLEIKGNVQRILGFVKGRLFSFALVLAVGFVLLVSLVINAWIAALGTFYPRVIPELEAIFHILDAALSFLVTTALFAAIYKVIPDVRSEWRDVILGGAVTSGLFTGGKVLLGLYLGKASFASTYGAAGSLVVFMIWVYYSSQIFFLGAEFTKIFATRYGSQPTLHPEGMIVSASSVDIHPDTTIIKPV